MVAISLHRLWLISKTTKRPTTSEFLQLLRTSAKFFQSAFSAILYQAFSDAPHSLCWAVASRIAFRLTIRINHLRNLRSQCQAKIRLLPLLDPHKAPAGRVAAPRSAKKPPRGPLFLLFRQKGGAAYASLFVFMDLNRVPYRSLFFLTSAFCFLVSAF